MFCIYQSVVAQINSNVENKDVKMVFELEKPKTKNSGISKENLTDKYSFECELVIYSNGLEKLNGITVITASGRGTYIAPPFGGTLRRVAGFPNSRFDISSLKDGFYFADKWWYPTSDKDALIFVLDNAVIGFQVRFENKKSYNSQKETIIDKRDGRKYEIIKIGNQTWMTKNLDVSIFRNGDKILEAKTTSAWIKAGENKQPAWCYYENNPENKENYGKLYNWYAVTDRRGLAPVGWHIPSQAEWTKLFDYLGGESAAGYELKDEDGWDDFGNGSNNSGFSGLPGGECNNTGVFSYIGKFGTWWSSSESDVRNAWIFYMSFGYNSCNTKIDLKQSGYSVRCLKD